MDGSKKKRQLDVMIMNYNRRCFWLFRVTVNTMSPLSSSDGDRVQDGFHHHGRQLFFVFVFFVRRFRFVERRTVLITLFDDEFK